MSWVSDDGRHEGYAAYVLRDGRAAVFYSCDGLGAPTGDGVDVEPWSELAGWEARCECGWIGPMWRRPADDETRHADDFHGATEGIYAAWEAHIAQAYPHRV